jgi:hypothetical protein
MTVEPIGLIALVLGLISMFLEPAFVVYVFFASTLLGAAAALTLPSLGGATIQPAHLLLGFLTVRLLSIRDVRAGVFRAAAFGSPGFWLLITAGYALLTAYIMPRLFLGQTFVYMVRVDQESYATLLAPTTSNLTQSVYFLGDCVCFMVLSGLGSSDAGRKYLGQAILMCVVLNLVFACLDLATFATGTTELMSFIRNANYSILSDNYVADFKRIIGSFTEASSFAYWTLGYFAFTLSLWLNGISSRLNFSLSILSFLALLSSSSTTAYVGLSAFLFFQFVFVGLNALYRPALPQQILFMFGAPFLLLIVVIAICLNDAASHYVANLLDAIIFNKMSSGSGVERSSWNNQAIQAFLDTYGFGVGVGSVRASSFPVAVIASLGFVGAVTYTLFLLSIWFGKSGVAPREARAIQLAARFACFSWLIGASSSGAFIDLGLPFFCIAAVACTDPSLSRGRLSTQVSNNPRLVSTQI